MEPLSKRRPSTLVSPLAAFFHQQLCCGRGSGFFAPLSEPVPRASSLSPTAFMRLVSPFLFNLTRPRQPDTPAFSFFPRAPPSLSPNDEQWPCVPSPQLTITDLPNGRAIPGLDFLFFFPFFVHFSPPPLVANFISRHLLPVRI